MSRSMWLQYSIILIVSVLVVLGISSNLISDRFDGLVSTLSVAVGGTGGYLSTLLLTRLFLKFKDRIAAWIAIMVGGLTGIIILGGVVTVISLASKFGLDVAAVAIAGLLGGFAGISLSIGGWYSSAASKAILGGISGAISVGIFLSLLLAFFDKAFSQFLKRADLTEFPGGLLVGVNWYLLGILAGIVSGLVYFVSQSRKRRSHG